VADTAGERDRAADSSPPSPLPADKPDPSESLLVRVMVAATIAFAVAVILLVAIALTDSKPDDGAKDALGILIPLTLEIAVISGVLQLAHHRSERSYRQRLADQQTQARAVQLNLWRQAAGAAFETLGQRWATSCARVYIQLILVADEDLTDPRQQPQYAATQSGVDAWKHIASDGITGQFLGILAIGHAQLERLLGPTGDASTDAVAAAERVRSVTEDVRAHAGELPGLANGILDIVGTHPDRVEFASKLVVPARASVDKLVVTLSELGTAIARYDGHAGKEYVLADSPTAGLLLDPLSPPRQFRLMALELAEALLDLARRLHDIGAVTGADLDRRDDGSLELVQTMLHDGARAVAWDRAGSAYLDRVIGDRSPR
jgi:hypothetical protein